MKVKSKNKMITTIHSTFNNKESKINRGLDEQCNDAHTTFFGFTQRQEQK